MGAVKKLNVKKKVNPIVRENDNTMALEQAELRAKARWAHIKVPDKVGPHNSTTVLP